MVDDTDNFFVDLINKCKGKNKKGDRSNRLIYNADIGHAKIAVGAILDVAIEDGADVRIMTDSLRKDFYSDSELVSKVKQVLARQRKVEIIVLDKGATLDGNDFAEAVIADTKNGAILYGDGEVSAPHFIVVGDRVFRLETDHNETKATICFNNESMGGCLFAEFNRLKDILAPKQH